jgi:hypothetical protein
MATRTQSTGQGWENNKLVVDINDFLGLKGESMPNLTTGFPKKTGNLESDYENLYNWSVSLIDELKSILCNLDSGNVTEANSVKAQNIDCTQARIKDAQMQSITADKLTAGTIDARDINVININADNINTGTLNSEIVNIESEDAKGKLILDGDSLIFYEKDGDKIYQRIAIGRGEDGKYIFTVQNRDGTQGVYMDSGGNINITGNIGGASNISVTSDVDIGETLNFKDRDTQTNGGIISISNNRLYIAGVGSRGIEIYTKGNIDLNCGSCRINGKNVLTD